MTHRKMAEDCWRLIRALAPDDSGTWDWATFDAAAINLIEMACDSAVEAQQARVKAFTAGMTVSIKGGQRGGGKTAAAHVLRPREGQWAGEPMTKCHLEADSPSYPPSDDERRQCDCASCRRELTETVQRGDATDTDR